MNPNVRHIQRRTKQIVAGVLFVGLLVGASGTVFTAFAAAISQLGQPASQTTVSTGTEVSIAPVTPSFNLSDNSSQASTPQSSASGSSNYQPPVMEYSNSQQGVNAGAMTQGGGTASASVMANDGVHSELADAMDATGVYVGERVQNAFGSMLKGVLNTLFINTN